MVDVYIVSSICCFCFTGIVDHINDKHIQNEWRADRKYVCYWAGCVRAQKEWPAKYKLVGHIRTHTGTQFFIIQVMHVVLLSTPV